uniref:Uncharacterized protein n=1 Tax=Tanacetum cinerariifolium TaxID=118510 RepID=A0A6L2LHK7_TANCI|nr:hypothetical protein [Tanacetum cinerariifolium]
MAKLAFCDYHNMVAILLKTEHNSDFHQIVDFLEASHIRTVELFASMLVPQGEGSEHPSEPHHTPSDQDKPIHHEQITQSPQHAQITSHEPIYLSHEQTTSQELTIPSQSHFVITTPKRITRGTIQISQSKVPLLGADETTFPTRDARYGEAFPTDTSLDAGQDRENIAKTSAMPHEALPKEDAPNTRGRGMDQGEDLLDKDKSADKGSDSTDEMSHILGTLEATNILASRCLSKKDKGKRKMTEPEQPSKENVLEQMSVQLARDLEAKFAQEDQVIREQAERDSEIAMIHVEKELEMMIA